MEGKGDLTRRAFLAGAAALGVAACGGGSSPSAASGPTASSSSLPSSSSSHAGGPARFASTGKAGRNRVALTFHTNGDVGLYHQLADLFARRRVPVTAFIVGNWLERNPDLGKQLAAAGHELANHTYTHPTFLSLSAQQMQDEIGRCRSVVESASGSGGALFRISGTSDGLSRPPDAVLQLAGAEGYSTVLGFDVDPLDFEDPGADAVARRTIAALHDGAIVSLHFGHAGTVAAMPRIVDALEAKGLTPVTASSILV